MPKLKRILVFFIFQWICTVGFSQGSADTIRGTLEFNFLGYPTLYQMDSLTRRDLVHKLEKKHLSRKDKWLEEYRLVYNLLKQEGKEGYPCVEVLSGRKYLIVYLPVEMYHQLIEKGSNELEKKQEQVVFRFSGHVLHGKYYVMDALHSVEYKLAPGIRYGHKFAVTEYSW